MRLSTQFCLISTWHSLIQSCNPSLIYSSISSFTIVIYQWIQEHEDLFYFLCSVVYLLIYLFIYLFICLVEMALTVDQVFEKIGSFGRYQKLLLLGCNGLIFFWMGFAVLIMTFIAADPGWKCVANSTQCRFNGSMAASDKRRCDMNRSEWVFNDDLTSVATEVSDIWTTIWHWHYSTKRCLYNTWNANFRTGKLLFTALHTCDASHHMTWIWTFSNGSQLSIRKKKKQKICFCTIYHLFNHLGFFSLRGMHWDNKKRETLPSVTLQNKIWQ